MQKALQIWDTEQKVLVYVVTNKCAKYNIMRVTVLYMAISLEHGKNLFSPWHYTHTDTHTYTLYEHPTLTVQETKYLCWTSNWAHFNDL